MPTPIRVTILDDHQSIIDGYVFRLSSTPGFKISSTISYGEELELALATHPTDILLLDINVPTSAENTSPYPILHEIPNLLQKYPNLNILVISMFAERSLIKAVMEAGASGYVLKDDQATIRDLGNVVASIANGGIYFSQKAHKFFVKSHHIDDNTPLTPRQLEALSLCAAYPDATTAHLAQKMTVSNSTIRNLLSGAYIRLNVHSRPAAIEKARQLGLITPHSQAPLVEE